MSGFPQRLKMLRESREMTQEDLAEVLGISRSALGSYEQSAREPSLDLLETIADFFNVDMNYLLGKTNITTSLGDITTIAAHKNNIDEDWTEEELKEIEDFKKFIRMKRESR